MLSCSKKFTARQRGCGKVMFAVVSACHSVNPQVVPVSDHYLDLFNVVHLRTPHHSPYRDPPTHVQTYFLGPHHAGTPHPGTSWLYTFMCTLVLTLLSHRSCECYYCDRFSTMSCTWVAVCLPHRGISGRPPKLCTFLDPNQKLRGKSEDYAISAQKFGNEIFVAINSDVYTS